MCVTLIKHIGTKTKLLVVCIFITFLVNVGVVFLPLTANINDKSFVEKKYNWAITFKIFVWALCLDLNLTNEN